MAQHLTEKTLRLLFLWLVRCCLRVFHLVFDYSVFVNCYAVAGGRVSGSCW
jgi:hypothetical protein